ncbi:MAG: FAD:protein FMN transferase [Gallionella sp.]|nr:FAD:protein FMN transferase [Gallionella sp.]MDD4959182.1 FAD:protein FMN transferase [Gallionella sp.]
MIRILLVAALLLLTACSEEPLSQSQSFVFGTRVELSVYGVPEPQAQQAMADVLQEFQRLHDMLHAWQPSELSALNTAFATGKSMIISHELAMMLQDATQISLQSKGLFNPTIGSLVKLWGFHRDEFTPVQPDKEQLILSVKAKPQMSDITLRPLSDGRYRASSGNFAVKLDLGGYAKGYALDHAAEILRRRGIHNALINIGGNVLALGKHGHRAWRVGIQHPRTAGALATLALHDGEAIGTSGDYQRYFMLDNVRYCHLIDPRTARPMQGVQAVTILTHGKRAGVLSDAASKPLFISGRQGWRVAATQMNLPEAMLIDAQGQVHLTKALAKRLEFTDKNTIRKIE